LKFNDYQYYAGKTAVYPNRGDNLYYPSLGLAGEAGEVCEKVKKIMRDKQGLMTTEDIDEIEKELGDVLWYISALCDELQINMGSVALKNIEKLESRQDRGKIQGSGDNR
jgi:NTP pyrophosphatase (non-canonical NTP hydrolase)